MVYAKIEAFHTENSLNTLKTARTNFDGKVYDYICHAEGWNTESNIREIFPKHVLVVFIFAQ